MFDTHTIQTNIKANEQEYRFLQDKERALVHKIADKKNQVASYKADFERRENEAKKYKTDYERVEAEYNDLQNDLVKITPQLKTYQKNIADLENQFRRLSDEMARATKKNANDNSPKQKRYG